MATKRKICNIYSFLVTVIYLWTTTATSIDCDGKPFHCVNSTHFMICVDVGAGVSKTVDDFLIQCPPTTFCRKINNFECEYQVTTTTESILRLGDETKEFELNSEITTDFPFTKTSPTELQIEDFKPGSETTQKGFIDDVSLQKLKEIIVIAEDSLPTQEISKVNNSFNFLTTTDTYETENLTTNSPIFPNRNYSIGLLKLLEDKVSLANLNISQFSSQPTLIDEQKNEIINKTDAFHNTAHNSEMVLNAKSMNISLYNTTTEPIVTTPLNIRYSDSNSTPISTISDFLTAPPIIELEKNTKITVSDDVTENIGALATDFSIVKTTFSDSYLSGMENNNFFNDIKLKMKKKENTTRFGDSKQINTTLSQDQNITIPITSTTSNFLISAATIESTAETKTTLSNIISNTNVIESSTDIHTLKIPSLNRSLNRTENSNDFIIYTGNENNTSTSEYNFTNIKLTENEKINEHGNETEKNTTLSQILNTTIAINLNKNSANNPDLLINTTLAITEEPPVITLEPPMKLKENITILNGKLESNFNLSTSSTTTSLDDEVTIKEANLQNPMQLVTNNSKIEYQVSISTQKVDDTSQDQTAITNISTDIASAKEVGKSQVYSQHLKNFDVNNGPTSTKLDFLTAATTVESATEFPTTLRNIVTNLKINVSSIDIHTVKTSLSDTNPNSTKNFNDLGISAVNKNEKSEYNLMDIKLTEKKSEKNNTFDNVTQIRVNTILSIHDQNTTFATVSHKNSTTQPVLLISATIGRTEEPTVITSASTTKVKENIIILKEKIENTSNSNVTSTKMLKDDGVTNVNGWSTFIRTDFKTDRNISSTDLGTSAGNKNESLTPAYNLMDIKLTGKENKKAILDNVTQINTIISQEQNTTIAIDSYKYSTTDPVLLINTTLPITEEPFVLPTVILESTLILNENITILKDKTESTSNSNVASFEISQGDGFTTQKSNLMTIKLSTNIPTKFDDWMSNSTQRIDNLIGNQKTVTNTPMENTSVNEVTPSQVYSQQFEYSDANSITTSIIPDFITVTLSNNLVKNKEVLSPEIHTVKTSLTYDTLTGTENYHELGTSAGIENQASTSEYNLIDIKLTGKESKSTTRFNNVTQTNKTVSRDQNTTAPIMSDKNSTLDIDLSVITHAHTEKPTFITLVSETKSNEGYINLKLVKESTSNSNDASTKMYLNNGVTLKEFNLNTMKISTNEPIEYQIPNSTPKINDMGNDQASTPTDTATYGNAIVFSNITTVAKQKEIIMDDLTALNNPFQYDIYNISKEKLVEGIIMTADEKIDTDFKNLTFTNFEVTTLFNSVQNSKLEGPIVEATIPGIVTTDAPTQDQLSTTTIGYKISSTRTLSNDNIKTSVIGTSPAPITEEISLTIPDEIIKINKTQFPENGANNTSSNQVYKAVNILTADLYSLKTNKSNTYINATNFLHVSNNISDLNKIKGIKEHLTKTNDVSVTLITVDTNFLLQDQNKSEKSFDDNRNIEIKPATITKKEALLADLYISTTTEPDTTVTIGSTQTSTSVYEKPYQLISNNVTEPIIETSYWDAMESATVLSDNFPTLKTIGVTITTDDEVQYTNTEWRANSPLVTDKTLHKSTQVNEGNFFVNPITQNFTTITKETGEIENDSTTEHLVTGEIEKTQLNISDQPHLTLNQTRTITIEESITSDTFTNGIDVNDSFSTTYQPKVGNPLTIEKSISLNSEHFPEVQNTTRNFFRQTINTSSSPNHPYIGSETKNAVNVLSQNETNFQQDRLSIINDKVYVAVFDDQTDTIGNISYVLLNNQETIKLNKEDTYLFQTSKITAKESDITLEQQNSYDNILNKNTPVTEAATHSIVEDTLNTSSYIYPGNLELEGISKTINFINNVDVTSTHINLATGNTTNIKQLTKNDVNATKLSEVNNVTKTGAVYVRNPSGLFVNVPNSENGPPNNTSLDWSNNTTSKAISDYKNLEVTKPIIKSSLPVDVHQTGQMNLSDTKDHLLNFITKLERNPSSEYNKTVASPSRSTLLNDAERNVSLLKQIIPITLSNEPSQYANKLRISKSVNTNVGYVNSVPFNCINRLRGRHADNNDCRKFYICIGRVNPVLGECPLNTVFSEIKKQCTKNLSHCMIKNEFNCIQEGRFRDLLKNNVYYICVKNKSSYVRFQYQCQNGFHLNKTSVRCVRDTQSQSQTSSTSTDSDSNKASDQSQSSTLGITKEKKNQTEKTINVCRQEGKFPDPDDCRKYYVCSKNSKSVFRRRTKKCDSDEVFHREKKRCVSDESYECK